MNWTILESEKEKKKKKKKERQKGKMETMNLFINNGIPSLREKLNITRYETIIIA